MVDVTYAVNKNSFKTAPFDTHGLGIPHAGTKCKVRADDRRTKLCFCCDDCMERFSRKMQGTYSTTVIEIHANGDMEAEPTLHE